MYKYKVNNYIQIYIYNYDITYLKVKLNLHKCKSLMYDAKFIQIKL